MDRSVFAARAPRLSDGRIARSTATVLCLGILGGCGGNAVSERSDGSSQGGTVSTSAGGGSGTIGGDAASLSTGGSSTGSSSTADSGGGILVDARAVDGFIDFDAGCERDVSLTAVTLTEAPPFDLVIVADHSKSLAWSRDELSSGLQNLLADVQGRSVRVFLLTPTQYGASSALAQVPLAATDVVAWKDPATGQAYTNEMTNFVAACTDPKGVSIACPSSRGPTPYKMQGTWKFNMPAPIAQIGPNLTSAQFAAQQKAVVDAILAIGGSGSPHEQPLCTLSRYVGQDAASLPKNAVFLVISDEDDVSTPADCLASFDAELQVTEYETGTSACSSNCDAYRYSMAGEYDTEVFTIGCAAFDDLGKKVVGSDKPNRLNQAGNCDMMTAGPCTAAESAAAAPFCDQGLTLVTCNRSCERGQTSCSVDLHDATVNACTQSFTMGGIKYQNLAAYCAAVITGKGWGSCSGGGVNLQKSTSTQGTYSPTSLMSGTTTADVGRYFSSKVKTVFSLSSYSVEAIVLDPTFSCTLGPGQSYATNIAGVVGDRSHLFPLCQSYAPALAGVLGFAQTLIQTQFSVPTKADEHVTSVYVVARDGSERALADVQFSYDAKSQTLVIDRTAIKGTDATLRVQITSDCRPIVH